MAIFSTSFVSICGVRFQKSFENHPPQDDEGYSALHWAAWEGHSEIVYALLSHEDIDVTALDGNGHTAYCGAVVHGQGCNSIDIWTPLTKALSRALTIAAGECIP